MLKRFWLDLHLSLVPEKKLSTKTSKEKGSEPKNKQNYCEEKCKIKEVRRRVQDLNLRGRNHMISI
ncbi:MAG: hypothetical protein CL912_12435 [Deltaproteobacteria bacterium]|nr:hypothetical protein [Deltaproteobacteria bacterium]